jgi:hypothetical protein
METMGTRSRPRWAGTIVVVALLATLGACGGDDEPPRRATVWAVGDGPDGSSDAEKVADWIVDQRPDRFFYLGDVYREPDYTPEEEEAGEPEADGAEESGNPMVDYYEPAYGRLAQITSPVAGDHEWEDDREDYQAYWREKRGSDLPPWYSERLAGWQVIVLNTEEDLQPGSEQHEWLRRQVRGSGTCRIALMHRPRFSAGEDGDHDDLAPAWDALGGKASMVLSGDDHNMQRLEPVDGITQFVSGAGGRSNYDVDEEDERLAFGSDDDDGALRLDLRPGRARHAFVNVEGETLDSGEIRCRR